MQVWVEMDVGRRFSLSHSCFVSLKIMAVIICLRIKVSTGCLINCRRDVSQSVDELSKKKRIVLSTSFLAS